MEQITALDLFCGTGVGVACRRLGIREMGVDNMPEVVATRSANGMMTLFRDVWEGLTGKLYIPKYQLLWASPPCQTFSMAGNGKGRAALDEVLQAIHLGAYKDPAELIAFGERHDMRTALVLAPLAYIWRDRPEYIALEQVPTVLPVWEAYAVILRQLGYNVKVANLHAEQYGVPQTRKRAILVARLHGTANLPVPTHSKYHSRDPKRLDPGVKKWVSMAEALGWNREGVTFTQNNRQAHQAKRTLDQPAPTVTAGHDSGNRGFLDEADNLTVATPDEVAVLQSYPASAQTYPGDPVFRNGNQANAAKRELDQPAPTLHFGARSNKVEWIQPGLMDDPAASGERVTVEEAAALQTYPSVVGFPRLADGQDVVTIDGVDYRARDLRADTEPAQTVTEKARSWNRYDADGNVERITEEEAAALQTYPSGWGFTERPAVTVGNAVGRGLIGGSGAKETVVQAIDDGTFVSSPHGDGSSYAEKTRITVDEAATLQSYPVWAQDRPSTTVLGDPRIATAGHHDRQMKDAYRATVDEVSTLQTYPEEPPFIWKGTKSKIFLQIGNAVPPLLAQRILEALLNG